MKRILEDELGRLEADAVLALVGAALRLIPREHVYRQLRSYRTITHCGGVFNSPRWHTVPEHPLLSHGRAARQYATAKCQHVFRDFIDAVAYVMIDERDITLRFQKRARNPLALAAGFAKSEVRVPWLGRKRLQPVFG